MMNYAAPSLWTSLKKEIHMKEIDLIKVITNLKPKSVLYHCYYNLEPRDSFKDYSGLVSLAFGLLHIDLDHEDPTVSFFDTKKLSSKLTSENIPHRVYFSGRKGFHIATPAKSFGLDWTFPKEDLEDCVKQISFRLKKDYPTVDTGIWDATRKFRAYRSSHEKTGLYKIELPVEKLYDLTIEGIRFLASEQPSSEYSPYIDCEEQSEWALGLYKLLSKQESLVELPKTEFKQLKNKPCIEKMKSVRLEQFNRHDIGLRILSDCKKLEMSNTEILSTMRTWADEVFKNDSDKTSRIKDIERMIRDQSVYDHGCYDDVKKAYCSSKCDLYSKLDKDKRANVADEKPKINIHELFLSANDLINNPIPEPEWIIDSKLHFDGGSIIGGAPKAGKSTFSRAMALSIAKGKDFLGYKTKQVPVLYLSLEGNLGLIQKHFIQLGMDKSDPIWFLKEKFVENVVEVALAACHKLKTKFVIIDTLGKAFRGKKVNDYEVMVESLRQTTKIASEINGHVMLIHHTSKASFGSSFLGSQSIEGETDCNWFLERRQGGQRFIRTEQRAGIELDSTELIWCPETNSISLGETKAEIKPKKKDNVQVVIINFLCANLGKRFTPKEIHRQVGGSIPSIQRVIYAMANSGKLKTDGMGGYGLDSHLVLIDN